YRRARLGRRSDRSRSARSGRLPRLQLLAADPPGARRPADGEGVAPGVLRGRARRRLAANARPAGGIESEEIERSPRAVRGRVLRVRPGDLALVSANDDDLELRRIALLDQVEGRVGRGVEAR